MGAMVGIGTTITFASSGFSAKVRNITGPGMKRTSVEAKYQGAAGNWVDKLPGMIDPGQISLEIVFEGTQAPITGVTENITITWPDGSTAAGSGFLTEWTPTDPLDDLCTADITIECTGEWTITPAP